MHAKSLFAEPGRWLLGTGTMPPWCWLGSPQPIGSHCCGHCNSRLPRKLITFCYNWSVRAMRTDVGQHVLASIQLVLTGFIAASLTGLPLGLLMGLSRPAYFFFNGIFQIMRPIAPIAWIPLTILWFGLGATAKVFVIWLAAFAPVVINTQTGVRNVEPVLIAAARAHGALGRTILFDIVIPGALPTIFTGLRISLQACWMVLVAAELVGSFAGLGHIMIIATRDLNPGMIVVAMAGVATLGVLFTATLSFIERQVTPWRR